MRRDLRVDEAKTPSEYSGFDLGTASFRHSPRGVARTGLSQTVKTLNVTYPLLRTAPTWVGTHGSQRDRPQLRTGRSFASDTFRRSSCVFRPPLMQQQVRFR